MTLFRDCMRLTYLIGCCAMVYAIGGVDYQLICNETIASVTTAECQSCPVDGCDSSLLNAGCWRDTDYWYKPCMGDLSPCIFNRWQLNNDDTLSNPECRWRCPRLYETCKVVKIIPTTQSPTTQMVQHSTKPSIVRPDNTWKIIVGVVVSVSVLVIVIVVVVVVVKKRRNDKKKMMLVEVEMCHMAVGDLPTVTLTSTSQEQPPQQPPSQRANINARRPSNSSPVFQRVSRQNGGIHSVGTDRELLLPQSFHNSNAAIHQVDDLDAGPSSRVETAAHIHNSNQTNVSAVVHLPTSQNLNPTSEQNRGGQDGDQTNQAEAPVILEEPDNTHLEQSVGINAVSTECDVAIQEDIGGLRANERAKQEQVDAEQAAALHESESEQRRYMKIAEDYVDNDGNIAHNELAATGGGAAAGSTTPNRSDILDGTRRKGVRARGGLENRPMSGDPSSGNETVEVTNGMKEKISLRNQPANSSTNGNHPDSHQKGAYSAPSTSTSGSSTRASSNTSTPASSNTSTPNLNRDGSLTTTNDGPKVRGSAKPESTVNTTVDDADEDGHG